MMKRILFLIATLSACEGTDFFRFVRDFASEEFFWTPYYNVIECSQKNEIEWTRSVSAAHHGLLTIHKATESLALWVNNTEIQTIFLDLNCPEADSVLMQANAMTLFSSSIKWLLLDEEIFENESPRNDGEGSGSWNTSESTVSVLASANLESKWYWNALKDYAVLLNAEVRMTEKMEGGKVRIVGAYKTWKEGALIRDELGEWSPRTGLTVRTRKSTAIRRWNVRGAPLPGSFPITHPETLNHLEDMVDKHVDPICKVGYILTKHFAEMINASLELNVVYTWGIQTNGSWTGMVGDLQSGAAEIGVSPAFVLEERMSIIKYYEMITPTSAKFIFLSPPLSFSSNIFAMPFDRMVWFSILLMIIISCIALYLTVRVETNRSRTEAEPSDLDDPANDNLENSFSDILMLNVGAICMQGAAIEPKGQAGRTIALFLYFSYMFLYVSYSGSIVALLQSSDTSIQTFKDLKDSSLSAGADDVVYSRYYFMTEQDPIRKALYEKKIAPKGEKPHFLPPEEGVEKIRNGLYAYHVEASVGYSLIQKVFTEEEKCGLQEFKSSFFQTVDPLLTMKFGSPFTEHLRIGMKRIIETGLNHRALSRIYTKKPICNSKSSRFVSVGLIDCYFAFFIVSYGTLLAICVLFIERLVSKFR